MDSAHVCIFSTGIRCVNCGVVRAHVCVFVYADRGCNYCGASITEAARRAMSMKIPFQIRSSQLDLI